MRSRQPSEPGDIRLGGAERGASVAWRERKQGNTQHAAHNLMRAARAEAQIALNYSKCNELIQRRLICAL